MSQDSETPWKGFSKNGTLLFGFQRRNFADQPSQRLRRLQTIHPFEDVAAKRFVDVPIAVVRFPRELHECE
jgi:hypothetical protein